MSSDRMLKTISRAVKISSKMSFVNSVSLQKMTDIVKNIIRLFKNHFSDGLGVITYN